VAVNLPYESTDANVTLGPFARAELAGRMIAWLELFGAIAGFQSPTRQSALATARKARDRRPRTPMIVVTCISVFAVLVFLSLTGSLGKTGSR
jgi:hypothetical protein